MSSDDFWNLKPELRETAREAARRRGISVNEWLQSVIQESAGEKLPARPRRRAARDESSDRGEPSVQDGMNAIGARLDELTRQLDDMSRAKSSRGPKRRPASRTDDDDDVSSTLRAIEGRLEALARPAPAHSARPLNELLTRLDRRLDRLMQQRPTNAPRQFVPMPAASPSPTFPDRHDDEDEHSTLGLDSAVAEIAARQHALDSTAGTLRQQFSALAARLNPSSAIERKPAAPVSEGRADSELQEQLRVLTDELQAIRRPGGFEHAMAALRDDLAGISRQLAEAAPRRALQALETEVHTLTERVEQSRHQTDPVLLTNIERSLDEVRSVLMQFAPAETLATFRDEVRAIDRKLEAIATSAAGSASDREALRHLQRSVAELREIAAHAASGEALIALAEEVQAIGDKVDRFISAKPGPDLSSLIDQRFRELATHLEANAGSAGLLTGDHMTVLVEQLADKLDRLELGRENAPMLDAIAKQITRLTEHAESAETRLDHLDHFERATQDLLRGMDELHASAIAAAERAAQNLVREARQQSPVIDPEFIRNELDALRQGHVQSDRRTQDTLEAVHDTLERLVDRLASVETDLRSRKTEASAVKPIEPAHAPSLAPQAASPAEGARPPPVATAASTARERRPFDPTLPADHPLEPGSAARARQGGSAAERIAASEAALGAARPLPDADAKSNFIAAARRAAQAAAANASPPGETGAHPEKAGSAFGALAQRLSGRKPLLLGLVLLISAGTLHLIINGVGLGGGRSAPTATQVSSVAEPAPAKPASASASAPTPAPDAAAPDRTAALAKATSFVSPTTAPASAGHGTAIGTGTSGAPSPEAASRPESQTVPTISPLTIASIQLPAGDVTSSIGRATGLAPPAPMPPAIPASPDLPASFEKGLRAAALAGDPAAAYEVAARYAEGRGTALNFEEALRWFERAANHGLAPAQYRLGSLYEKGNGTKKDLEKARRLYRAAAGKGNAKAMHNLAVLHAEGIDGKPDLKAAAEWFRKAASRGVADSQYNLGILYARGLGAPQNLAESYKWFALAAQQGDQDASKKRDDVAARLDQQALVAARLAVQTFVAEPQPEEATTVKAPAGGWDRAATPTTPKAQQRTPRKINRS